MVYSSKRDEFDKTVEMLKILFKVEHNKFSSKKVLQHFVVFVFLFAGLLHSPDQHKTEAWTVNAIMPKLRLISEKKIEQQKL